MQTKNRILSLACALALLCGLAVTAPCAVAAEEPQWVEKTPMATLRMQFGAEAVNGLIYVFGGSDNKASLSSLVIYDPETDSWTDGAPMPTARAEISTAVVGGKVYALGGNPYSNTVEIYDPEADTWETGSPMPTPKFNFGFGQMDGKLYVLAGAADSGSSDTVEIYDPKTDTWTEGTPAPFRVQHCASVSIGNKIYLLGGSYQTKDYVNSPGDKMLIYDVEADTWEIDSIPEDLSFATAIAVGNQIYLMGGLGGVSNDSPHSKKTLYIYDTSNKSWDTGPSLVRDVYNHASVMLDQTIYILGGMSYKSDDKYTYDANVEALELSTAPVKKKLAVLLNPEEAVQLSVSDNLADNLTFTWTSSNEGVATVGTDGRVTAIAPGLADITAKNADGAFNQSIPVRVFPGTADLFRLAVHLTPGQTKRLTMTEDNQSVTWRSLDETVLTVDTAGQISAVAPGLAIVEATAGDETRQMYVRVKE